MVLTWKAIFCIVIMLEGRGFCNSLLDSQGAPRNWKAHLPEQKLNVEYWMISFGDQSAGNPLMGRYIHEELKHPKSNDAFLASR